MAIAGARTHGGSWWHRLRETPVTVTAPAQPPDTGEPARRVAVLDDDMRYIRFVERALQLEGVEIQPVTTLDPEEAVRVIAEAGCDTALIDLCMYNDDQAGFTIARMLREDPRTRGIRMRLATGAELKRHEATLAELRCGVLAKPFTAEDLLASLGHTNAAFRAA